MGERPGMLALVPTAANADRLAVDGGLSADDLHVTMAYLGDDVSIPDDVHAEIMDELGEICREMRGPLVAEAFNVALFNPHRDDRDTCITLGMSGGPELEELCRRIRERILEKLAESSIEVPEQHTPWIPHLTLAYTDDYGMVGQYADRTGDVTFDRVRLAVGDDIRDVPLVSDGEPEDSEDTGEEREEVEEVEEIDIMKRAAVEMPDDFTNDVEEVYSGAGGAGMTAATEVENPDARESGIEHTPDADPGAWNGVLIVEDVESGDGRMFSKGSLKSAPLPMPLMWQKQTDEGHKTAVQVGRIDAVWRDGNEIWGEGVFDLEGADGQEAYRQVRQGFLRGVSGDVDSVKESDVELVFPKTAGTDDSDLGELFSKPELTVFHKGRLRGATLVQFPAFVEASIALGDSGEASDDVTEDIEDAEATEFTIEEHEAQTPAPAPAPAPDAFHAVAAALGSAGGHLHERAELTACGCTADAPPRSHFENPNLAGPTAPTLTADGRFYGHAALHGTCHTGFSGTCVTPPRERSHDYFLLGETLCADGSVVATGTVTLGTGHADTGGRITPMEAMSHYDHTGTAVADIVTGEDAFGLWFSGSVRKGVSPVKLRALRGAKLSGDWRKFGNSLRLVALLAVNVPGFPVPRVKAAVKRGRQMSLVAAGMNPHTARGQRAAEEHEALRSIVASLKARIGRDDESRMDALRSRIHGK